MKTALTNSAHVAMHFKRLYAAVEKVRFLRVKWTDCGAECPIKIGSLSRKDIGHGVRFINLRAKARFVSEADELNRNFTGNRVAEMLPPQDRD